MPTTETPSRGERRKARTEQAILAAAERAFRDRGYRAATVEEISEAADVAVGSIYHHFASKQGLYMAIVERGLAINETYMQQAYETPGTPLEKLFAASEAYLRFYADHPFYFQTIALPTYEMRGAAPEAALRIAEKVEQLVGRLEELIRAARDAGELLECDPRLTARFCWASWNGVIAAGLRPDGMRLEPQETRAVLQEGIRIMFEGLRP